MKSAKSMIGIQEEYIETLNAGIARWSHRPDGGHSGRISRGARHQAEKELRKLGFDSQHTIDSIIQDARDMAALARIPTDEVILFVEELGCGKHGEVAVSKGISYRVLRSGEGAPIGKCEIFAKG